MPLSLRNIVNIVFQRIEKVKHLMSLNKRPHEPDSPLSQDIKVAKVCESADGGTRGFRKCAIIMMYSGTGYFGMQKNDGFPTIEGELLSALYKSGYITEEHMKNPSIIHFQRASKTDKNVSSAGQVCAAKLPIDLIDMAKINAALPEQIRILDIFRVTKKFSPKIACNHRVYQYLLPTFAFAPRDILTIRDCWSYRLSASTLTLANKMFQRYKGTHNFFNFTSRRTPEDRSCIRYVMSIECGNPFLLAGDKEFAVITVQGQSFMLHQIRKMIGLVIAIVKGYTTEAVFEDVFKPERLDIPKAPGLGLLLDRVDYTRYNARFCGDGSHQPIDWEMYREKIDAFKDAYIFRHMVEREIEDNSMFEWMTDLDKHTYDKREDGSPDSSPNHTPVDSSQPPDEKENREVDSEVNSAPACAATTTTTET
ncbi:unnamed protein product [Mesocestoides corti]|uniref:Pseudouridylate synthase 1 homolog n=1 Tax=Mesocestoides corti TaxID=53468 RepID=A0A0R3U933_MESCO|nr:unnamed protein product [Mesocestoides corti]